jgi:hypothetical protein
MKLLQDNPLENVMVTIPFSKTIGTAHLTATRGSVTFDEINKVRALLSSAPKSVHQSRSQSGKLANYRHLLRHRSSRAPSHTGLPSGRLSRGTL